MSMTLNVTLGTYRHMPMAERYRDAMGLETVPSCLGSRRGFRQSGPLGLPQSPGHAPTSPFGSGLPSLPLWGRLARLHPWLRLGFLLHDLLNVLSDPGPVQFDPSNWAINRQCNPGGSVEFLQGNLSNSTGCFTSQFISPQTVTCAHTHVWVWGNGHAFAPGSPSVVYDLFVDYVRVGGCPGNEGWRPQRSFDPAVDPSPLPYWYPQIQPELRPPLAPVAPTPEPLPYPVIPDLPYNDPELPLWERPLRGPIPGIPLPWPGVSPPVPEPEPGPAPQPQPGPSPDPSELPPLPGIDEQAYAPAGYDPSLIRTVQEFPKTSEEPHTVGAPDFQVQWRGEVPPFRVFRPPARGVKERKVIVAFPPGILHRTIGRLTEGVDMVECMHDALPKQYQAKRLYHPNAGSRQGVHKLPQLSEARKGGFMKPSMKRKADALHDHLDKIDVAAAIEKCMWEQLKDIFYAKLGQTSAKLSRQHRLSHGFQLGPAL